MTVHISLQGLRGNGSPLPSTYCFFVFPVPVLFLSWAPAQVLIVAGFSPTTLFSPHCTRSMNNSTWLQLALLMMASKICTPTFYLCPKLKTQISRITGNCVGFSFAMCLKPNIISFTMLGIPSKRKLAQIHFPFAWWASPLLASFQI